ncbi:MAG: DUF1501 domain-containing protein [Bacteroidia bacterium]|nr:DUF1501 domain-containing protein [Bacteroidia bacterium]
MSKNSYSRRKFLGTLSCAALGGTTMLNTVLNLKAVGGLASPSYKMLSSPQNDYKALVCLLLSGGNDSFNMVVPREENAHKIYKKTRSNQALKKEDLLAISPKSGGQYGFHPSMPEAQKLFNDGNLAVVANVGTLVEPVSSLEDAINGLVKVPLGLFSHSDQIQQWQTSVPNERNSIGWGGKLADLLKSSNTNQDLSMGISLSGNNVFQSGNNSTQFTINPYSGSSGIRGYGGTENLDEIRTTAVKSLLEMQYQDIFKQTYADVVNSSQANHELFSTAVNAVKLNTIFSPNQISQSMAMIAKTIGARNTLGMSRQVFFVDFPGWDHHDELLNNQAAMLEIVSKAMSEFYAALGELGLTKEVTTFTISDFARTLNSNGNGTDHAWGGNALVMGGDVKGGTFYGDYPSLDLGDNQDIGGGVLIPKISTDEYFAELALWFGVSRSDLGLVFPNIANFYQTNTNTAPLGFLL